MHTSVMSNPIRHTQYCQLQCFSFLDLSAHIPQITLKTAAPKIGRAFTYNYDMTDPWAHIVEVVSIEGGGLNFVTKLKDGARAGIPEVGHAPETCGE